MLLRVLVVLGLLPVTAVAGDPVVPVTVCEVLGNLSALEGKDVAVLGRYSFRKDGRWIAEQACESPSITVPVLWLSEDGNTGPKPPGNFELDAAALNRKFAAVLKQTSLGKFKFGTPDYDRWAVVYGRVVAHKGDDKKASADLVFRGSGVVIFLTNER
jgi:hypothetical protein